MTEYLYTDVANRIQSQIENQELAVGQKLPSERKMSEHYGVSRNVIREALKILTEKGMLDIRPGKPATAVLTERRGIRHLVGQAKAEKPAVGDIDFDFLHQASLGADPEQVANE